MNWKKFKLNDFVLEFTTYDHLPEYNCLNISIKQGGYYGADTDEDLNGADLDEFLEECARFKKWRDEQKKK
jgi:hypothetical protein